MDNRNNKYVTYDEVYFTDIEKQIISAFQDGSSLLPSIDIPWMIKCFMKSTHRKKVEQGHPYWIGKIGAVVIRDLLENVDYQKSDKDKYYYGNKLYWIGKVYNYVSYKYDIPCSKLIDLITVDDMLKQYVTMHETGLEHTAEHLYEVFIQDKIREIK
ncbi:hypothetical protein DIC82_02435 [Clostridium beijerinckii]|nr:hypothetical protein DIC82_02435 [Clostridium beijerinckii]